VCVFFYSDKTLVPYTTESEIFRNNHPMLIMVRYFEICNKIFDYQYVNKKHVLVMMAKVKCEHNFLLD